ncbi:hypothetical protein D3P08_13485 [Paenibacillus nanensis]|uniref:Uncharacterized protein n=1 Tax=Paenibacillus nanensis TaxID=393251 RepID=A0A3A1UVA5_9BACL|nr:hypothetical protein [Paenibacillus nanensis]RIX52479.1 hypothetical protein D3P08_13485 [Paenibacillus nanensis]
MSDSLKDREDRLQLARRDQQAESPGAQTERPPAPPPGPPRANEQWKALYARIREVTEGLRR